jgi:hypothetical protein
MNLLDNARYSPHSLLTLARTRKLKEQQRTTRKSTTKSRTFPVGVEGVDYTIAYGSNEGTEEEADN